VKEGRTGINAIPDKQIKRTGIEAKEIDHGREDKGKKKRLEI
jgi:hypothetical protein